MDNTIAKLLDLFKHISRDIMIYAISGFVVIVNFFIIDKFYLGGIYFGLIEKLEYISLIIFILSYVIGHIIMSLMQIVDFIEPCIYKLFKFESVDFKYEVQIFKENQNIYANYYLGKILAYDIKNQEEATDFFTKAKKALVGKKESFNYLEYTNLLSDISKELKE